jgi:hypothetical protein
MSPTFDAKIAPSPIDSAPSLDSGHCEFTHRYQATFGMGSVFAVIAALLLAVGGRDRHSQPNPNSEQP